MSQILELTQDRKMLAADMCQSLMRALQEAGEPVPMMLVIAAMLVGSYSSIAGCSVEETAECVKGMAKRYDEDVRDAREARKQELS